MRTDLPHSMKHGNKSHCLHTEKLCDSFKAIVHRQMNQAFAETKIHFHNGNSCVHHRIFGLVWWRQLRSFTQISLFFSVIFFLVCIALLNFMTKAATHTKKINEKNIVQTQPVRQVKKNARFMFNLRMFLVSLVLWWSCACCWYFFRHFAHLLHVSRAAVQSISMHLAFRTASI